MTTTQRHESHREIVLRLSSAQKTVKGAPAYSRFINRRAGRHLAAVAYRLNLTPNQVTGISATFTFAAIALIALVQPRWWLGIPIAIGLVVGYAFDAADGQLSRLQGSFSRAGEWLDHMVDATKISSLHLAVLISYFRFGHLNSASWLLVPIGFTIVNNVLFFGMLLNDSLRRIKTATTGVPVAEGQPNAVRSLLVIPTDYGVLCLVFLLFGASDVFFGFYTFLFAGSAGFFLLAMVKWFRDMRQLDQA